MAIKGKENEVISIRVMGLRAEAGRAVIAITACPDLDVDSIRGPYVNRDDAKVRIYVNAELKTPEKKA
jgi:hypothetical protein